MLFGYLNAPKPTTRSDVESRQAPLGCLSFERPLLLASELHVAGAIAFANAHGLHGLSLARWALLQTLESASQRHEVEPPSRRSHEDQEKARRDDTPSRR